MTKQLPVTLAIDIGGTGIKVMLLDHQGQPLSEYLRELTPQPAKFKAVCDVLHDLINKLNAPFDRISAGFPGVVKNGVVFTAFNMHSSWVGVNFQQELENMTKKPVRIANDADIQGLGDISGHGVEMVITLGTGMGSSLFIEGKLIPNIQLGHHPFRKKYTYEDLLGRKGLKKHGIKKWRKHLAEAIELLDTTFNYTQLYIGGGNAHKINFILPDKVKISNNIEGVLGGFKLWQQ